MNNYYEIIIDNKIFIQRTPNSKFIEFTIDGIKQNSYDELPLEIKEIIEKNNKILENPEYFLDYKIVDNKVIIEKINKSVGKFFKIPEYIKGYPVVEIGKRILNDDIYDIEQLQLPYTLKKLNEYSFQNTTIKYINIPSSITEIPQKCFFASEIEYIDLTNIQKIDDNAFSDCNCLKKINLSNVKYFGEGVFAHCEQLKEVILPDTLTIIQDYLFYQCFSLEKINLPKELISIGKFSFTQTALHNIEFPDSLKEIGIYSFYRCKKLSEFIASPNLEKISYNAFEGCSNIVNIVLNNIQKVGQCAFKETNAKNVKIPKDIEYYSNAFPIWTNINEER